MTVELLAYLALIAVVAGGSYYAGWRSARGYLNAAEAVTSMAKEAQADRAEFVAALDNAGGAAARLSDAVATSTERVSGKLGGVEDALTILFDGFERGGFVKRATVASGPGRQHGEGPAESG